MLRLQLGLLGAGLLCAQQLPVEHAECTYFSQREAFVRQVSPGYRRLGAFTRQAVKAPRAAVDAPPPDGGKAYRPGSIDAYLFGDMQDAGVNPAPRTTDWEFIRRVTLDLTGRIPKPERVLAFVADSTRAKRAKLIDELLAAPEWVDKWTLFYGDLFKNTAFRPSTGVQRFASGRNAFYTWIHDSIASGKPYSQMATELITAQGDNSYQQGEVNWLVGGVVSGGPAQDITDQQTANVAEVFLGVAHVNCLLCHNGRGHLTTLSLWGANTSRIQAWQLAAFLSRTTAAIKRPDPTNPNIYYWSVTDNSAAPGYTLGTTTGNRPARLSMPSCAAGKPCYVPPAYIFDGAGPAAGENYRVALARKVTSDIQFARAAVNYVWAQFFGRGIVDPPNQFDPARLDPDNPPPAPWTLQPSNARLLNALAQRFIDNGYDLKALMSEIVNSDVYQLSSRYGGNWDPAWEPLFARKFVRRLWAEEIHDAIAQSSGVIPAYKVAGFTDLGFPAVSWAMQLPDTVNMPGGATTAFLDSFLRGNRDDADRKPEGSALQALNLMNDPFVIAHTQPSGATPNQLIALNKADPDLVDGIFLGILSRPPGADEKTAALAALGSGNRAQAAQNLVWSLYNKLDFVFNY